MKTKIKPGKGWRLLSGDEKPDWRKGDEMKVDTFWQTTGHYGRSTVAQAVATYPWVTAYRRRLNVKGKTK